MNAAFFLHLCKTGLSVYLKLVSDFVCPLWNEAVQCTCYVNIIVAVNPSITTFKHLYIVLVVSRGKYRVAKHTGRSLDR